MNDVSRGPGNQGSINQQSYETIASMIGEDSMQLALSMLLADVRAAQEHLGEAIQAGNESRARRVAHKLQGVADLFGLFDPGRRAARLASRHDLFWLEEATALQKVCRVWETDIAILLDAHVQRDGSH